jgi:molybdopterin/thiamine biosynthesis adenylyltransferase
MGRLRTAYGRFIQEARPDPLVEVLGHAEAVARLTRHGPTRGPTRRALGFGAGRMGTWTGFSLGRMGVPITFIDHDVVEPHNLTAGNCLFRDTDIGTPKALAMKRILAEYGVEAEAIQADITSLSASDLRTIAADAGVALGLVDEGEALFHINQALYHTLPVVYAAGHRGARTGDVAISRPGGACLRCLLDIQSPAEIQTLAGEATHGIDILGIAHACAKVALVLLGDPRLGDARELLDPAVNLLFMENRRSPTSPRGFASRFLRIERRRTCPICGAS